MQLLEWIIHYCLFHPSVRREIAMYFGWQPARRRGIVLPYPVKFSIVASLGMFLLLPFLPLHPMSLPIAAGAALCISLLIETGSSYGKQLFSVHYEIPLG